MKKIIWKLLVCWTPVIKVEPSSGTLFIEDICLVSSEKKEGSFKQKLRNTNQIFKEVNQGVERFSTNVKK